ncbi:flagellar assembly protein FliW [Arthrobacter sp. UCD-GKA]|uniref:flagellar assembly protein FliW n=1 Tax=Arthrobacter sp. UCD-GKA TaxID=1913576 RepID=UPI0009F56CB7|nr:flagellar assembly protein FliW [Arthrobacter sp. UCD-GKA]
MSRVLVPAAALPGFPEATTLSLEPVDGALGLYSLASPQAAGLRLFVLDASLHLADYKPVFTNEQMALLGEPEPASRCVLVVVNTSDSQASVNLLAPLVFNTDTGACAQLILEGQDWPIRSALPL